MHLAYVIGHFTLSCLGTGKQEEWDQNEVCWVLINIMRNLWPVTSLGFCMTTQTSNIILGHHDSQLTSSLSVAKINVYSILIYLRWIYLRCNNRKAFQEFLTVSKCLDLYSVVLSNNYLTSLWRRGPFTNRLHTACWHFRRLLY